MTDRGGKLERLSANLGRAFPVPTTPMDRTGDERLDDLLALLRDERDRRIEQKRINGDAGSH
jgi:hypothetical protein